MAAAAMNRAALATLLLLTACDPHALQRREAALSAYVGYSEPDLVRSLGVPTRSFAAGGHRFLAYEQSSVQIEPPLDPWRPWGFGWGYGGGFPAQVVQWTCETTFEVDAGRVVGFTLRGNACA
jgi:hypothetical protein